MKKAALCMLMIVLMLTWASAEELMIVTGGTLRMRAQPDFNAEVVERYEEGTVMTVREAIGEWFSVTAPDGKAGYMYGMYLKPAAEASAWEARVISDNGGDVNLRRMPRMGAEILAKVPVGTQVSVLSDAAEWRFITLPDGRSGYMMNRYLATEDGGIRYVTSTNGGGVHMRTGPSQEYRSLGVLHIGTQVTLLEAGSAWHRIRYGGHEGFMMARYLTTQPPQTPGTILRSVRMNSNMPRVGDILTATANPGSAQCLFIWSDDAGRLLGTGNRYQVKTDDIGQRIRVTVTGFGSTTGAAVSESSATVAK